MRTTLSVFRHHYRHLMQFRRPERESLAAAIVRITKKETTTGFAMEQTFTTTNSNAFTSASSAGQRLQRVRRIIWFQCFPTVSMSPNFCLVLKAAKASSCHIAINSLKPLMHYDVPEPFANERSIVLPTILHNLECTMC